MRPTVHLAKEVGTRLGFRHLLLRCLPLAGTALLVGLGRPWTAEAAVAGPRTATRTPGAALAPSPATAVAELLAADRAFAAAAAGRALPDAIAAMLAADAIMPAGPRGLVEGRDAIRAELARDTADAASQLHWAPVRGGLSGDGLHGFTFGFTTVRRADGRTVPGKYLAYWVKGSDGWQVAAFRRARRPEGAIDTTMLAPALPAAIQPEVRDAGVRAAHLASLLQAERDFAAESQVIGIRAGFAKFGSADAMNMGGPGSPGFVLGNEAIAALVAQGVPEGTSHVNWGPDRALVASTGDLGVTFGYITPNAAPPAGQSLPRFPFFTIWRRAGPGAPWRYVAE